MASKKKTNQSEEPVYFEVDPILKKYPKVRYFFLLGKRGTGKTFPVMKRAIQDAIDGKGVFAYVRRYKESLNEASLKDLMSPHNGGDAAWIEKYTNGRWNRVGYWRRFWYLEKWEPDENGTMHRVERNPVPIGKAVAQNVWETDKGPDFAADKGGMAHIIFDELLSAGGDYLSDEWGSFENVISSLVRRNWKKNTKIWLLANPVSKYGGPYLRNFGITKKMLSEFGTTLIEYPDAMGNKADMTTLFVYIAPAKDGKEGYDPDAMAVYSNFFAFKHSIGKALSITHGYWEMEDANIIPSGVYNDSEKKHILYYLFEESILAVELMKYKETGVYYLFVRPSDRVPKDAYFVTLEMSLMRRAIIGIGTGHPLTEAYNRIAKTNQIYYSDLETADIFHGFQKEAKNRKQ
ncbi:MAG: phage DNA encapsidation protein [Bacteroidaceae bacterium]|nr:phage DNA encapsidation protein [Bacteroidaceae bacterium]